MYAHVHTSTRGLVEAIDSIRSSVLIGGSVVGKAFTQAVIEAISRVNERPIIFALSNPT